MESLIVMVMFLASLAFSALVGVALITYVRRTWQLIRSESDQSGYDRILDGIDQLQTRLDVLTERVDGLERGCRPETPAGRSRRPMRVTKRNER